MGIIVNKKNIYVQDDNLEWWDNHPGERSAIINEYLRTLSTSPKRTPTASVVAPKLKQPKASKWHPNLESAWDYYLEKTGHTRTLTEQRKTKLNARLNEVGPETLKRAMDYLLGSLFHNGENDRKWKWDIDFLIRNTEQVEKFADLYQDKPKKKTFAEMFDEQ
jgi:hypothetical protein